MRAREKPEWAFWAGFGITAQCAIDAEGAVFVAAHDTLVAVNGSTGELLWSHRPNPGVFIRTAPAISSDGGVVVGTVDGFLYCFNDDGTLVLDYYSGSTLHAVVTGVSIAAGVVLAAVAGGLAWRWRADKYRFRRLVNEGLDSGEGGRAGVEGGDGSGGTELNGM